MNKPKRLSDVLRMVADQLDRNEDYVIHYILEHFICPLQESRIFTNNEIAEKLNVSPSQVSKLIKTGQLKTTSDGHVSEFHLRCYLTKIEENKSSSRTGQTS